jgi:hypothetical protein
MYAAPVDAAYANAYGYQADIAAKLTFRIVPVPPPDGADELRIVPDLTGRSPSAAGAALDALGLGAVLRDADGAVVETPADTDVVFDQTPAAGQILRLDDDVTLRIGTPA